jgi:hypothetical protein
VQENCIAAALELPGLDILWQGEFKDHFEITVIYRRWGAICPKCGVVSIKLQDRRRQRKRQEADRQSGVPMGA